MNVWHNIKSIVYKSIRPFTVYFTEYGLRAKFTVIFYLITLSSIGAVGYFAYQSASQAYYSKATELMNNQIAEVTNKINDITDLAYHDLDFLGGYQATLRYHYWLDIRDEKKVFYWKSLINNLLMEFLIANPHYYQIRFLDTQGVEQLGVKRAEKNNKSTVKINQQRQNKKKADYFIHGMALNKNETYASALLPNIEQGKIEQPLVPVIRFVTPIIGDNNVHYGMLVINILAKYYFQAVQSANKINPKQQFYLINQYGEYYFHNNPKKMFASILGHKANFKTDFPDLFANIIHDSENDHNTFNIHGKIISFQRIKPNGNNKNSFILVGIAEESTSMAELHHFIKLFFIVVLVVSLIILIAARRFIHHLMNPLEAVTRQLQALSEGKTNNKIIDYTADDEIGRIVASQRTLMTNMERLATQADIISSGDFSNTVPLLSKHDRLGKAINNMTFMLNESHRQTLHNNKLKDAINRLNQALTGKLTIQELADTSIGLIGRTLAAGRGGFYRYNAEQKNLTLLGSYMFSSHAQPGHCIQLGEGIIGQVARDQKTIVLHAAIDDIQPVITGTQTLIPQHIYSCPLLHEGQLLGVIEIAAFTDYQDFNLSFLNNATAVIASFFYTTEQNERIKKLLKFSEQAAQQTQEQNIKLKHVNALMKKQQKQLTQRAEELERASQYKSEFLANMSHELRTPLNAIILLSKMLAMNEEQHLTAEEVKRANIVHHSGEELLRLINDILDLSKIESGKMTLNLSTISTRELGAECYNLFSEIAKDKKLTFIIDDQIQTEFVSDRNKLAQIVRNLLSNAFKFTKQGCVTLCFKASGRDDLPLYISVTDTGIGITENKQQRVFDAFQQLDNSNTREYAGTGLGLSISQHFAMLLGGCIELQSVPNEGSCFSLLLPLLVNDKTNTRKMKTAVETDHRTTVLNHVASEQRKPPSKILAGRTILVIDDDPRNLFVVTSVLEQQGALVDTALNAQKGLEKLRVQRADLVFMDIMMQNMDGYEAIRTIRADSEFREIAIIVLTAKALNADREKALNAGADDYLAKPVDYDVLINMTDFWCKEKQ